MAYYRFPISDFVEATNFEEAKKKLLEQIGSLNEDKDCWAECTCVGLSHHYKCKLHEIPY